MSGGAGLNDNYLDVMEQYEGGTLEVRRGRGAWIFERSDGVKLLKEYRGSVKRLEFEETVLKGLKAHGIGSVDQYVRNRQGELVTSGEDGTKYVLKDWFVNRECNLKDSREILTAVTWIARLHQALREIAWQGEWDLASMHSPGLSEEMQRHTREMKRVRTFVSNKRKKSQFELCVMQNFSEFYEQALEAQPGLGILEKDLEEGRFFLCHGDLNQHHLLIGNGDVARSPIFFLWGMPRMTLPECPLSGSGRSYCRVSPGYRRKTAASANCRRRSRKPLRKRGSRPATTKGCWPLGSRISSGFPRKNWISFCPWTPCGNGWSRTRFRRMLSLRGIQS